MSKSFFNKLGLESYLFSETYLFQKKKIQRKRLVLQISMVSVEHVSSSKSDKKCPIHKTLKENCESV